MEENALVMEILNFYIFTHDFPEKRKELSDRISLLSDEEKSIVFKTISSLIYHGGASPKKIELDGCHDGEGIILNAQLNDGKWLLAIHENEIDPAHPYGDWLTFLSENKIENIPSGPSNELFKRYRDYASKAATLLNHDFSYYDMALEVNEHHKNNCKNYAQLQEDTNKKVKNMLFVEQEI